MRTYKEIVKNYILISIKIVRPMYQTIILNTQENNAFAVLRDTLLPKLMSGEIDVSEVQL